MWTTSGKMTKPPCESLHYWATKPSCFSRVSPTALTNLALLSTAAQLLCVSAHTTTHSAAKAGDTHQHWRKHWFLNEVLLVFLLHNNSSRRALVCVHTFLLHWFTFHISATIRGKIHVFQVFRPSFTRLNISIISFNWHFQQSLSQKYQCLYMWFIWVLHTDRICK